MGLVRLCTLCGYKHKTGVPCPKAKERHKIYDIHRRNKKSAKFYHSAEWQMVKAQVKARAYGLDELIYAREKRIVQGDVAHHIFPLTEHPEDALNPRKIIYLSHKTHNWVHAEYEKSEQNKHETQKLLLKCIGRG